MNNEIKETLLAMSKQKISELTKKLNDEIAHIQISTSPEVLTKIQANCMIFTKDLNKELTKVGKINI
jgi:hypothetical protein